MEFQNLLECKLSECRLCPQAVKLRDSLAQHFMEKHQDVNSDVGFTHYCNCAVSVVLQMEIINHLLSHFFKKQQLSELIQPEIIELDEDIIEESDFNKHNIQKCDTDGWADAVDSLVEHSSLENSRQKLKISDVASLATGKELQCKLCSASFNTREDLSSHLELNHDASHNGSTFKCKWCPKSNFKRHKALIWHQNRHRICDLCGDRFSRKGSRLHFTLKHSTLLPFGCDYPGCTKNYNSKLKLNFHQKQVHQKIACKKCLAQVSSKQMNKHIIVHHTPFNEKIHRKKCEFPGCSSGLTDKMYHLTHLLLCHNVETNSKSYDIDATQPTLQSLGTIKISDVTSLAPVKNSKEGQQYHCKRCPTSFYTKRGLDKHLTRNHNPLNIFKCELCPNVNFKSVKALNGHDKLHLKHYNLICDICGDRFNNKKNLWFHFDLNHFKKISFDCDYPGCTRKFHANTNLQKHRQQVHQKVACEKCFAMISYKKMKRHMLMQHTKFDKKIHQFKCNFPGCSAGFKVIQSRNIHQNYCHTQG